MAGGWSRATAQAIQDDQLGVATRTAPTTPMKLQVETTTGSDTAAGTALASTTNPSVTFAAATNAQPPVSANSAQVTVTCGSAGTVTYVSVYDSAATPVRKAYAPMGTSRSVLSGDLLVFAVGALAVQTASG